MSLHLCVICHREFRGYQSGGDHPELDGKWCCLCKSKHPPSFRNKYAIMCELVHLTGFFKVATTIEELAAYVGKLEWSDLSKERLDLVDLTTMKIIPWPGKPFVKKVFAKYVTEDEKKYTLESFICSSCLDIKFRKGGRNDGFKVPMYKLTNFWKNRDLIKPCCKCNHLTKENENV